MNDSIRKLYDTIDRNYGSLAERIEYKSAKDKTMYLMINNKYIPLVVNIVLDGNWCVVQQ